MVIVKRTFVIVLLSIALTSIGSCIYLSFLYTSTRPREPQPELQRIYPLNIHGTIVYLSEEEDSQLKWLFLIGVLSIGGAVTFNVIYNPFKS